MNWTRWDGVSARQVVGEIQKDNESVEGLAERGGGEGGVSELPTVSGGLPPIVLGLVGAPVFLLAVVPVSPVAVPSLALPPQRDVDADIHGPVAWGRIGMQP